MDPLGLEAAAPTEDPTDKMIDRLENNPTMGAQVDPADAKRGGEQTKQLGKEVAKSVTEAVVMAATFGGGGVVAESTPEGVGLVRGVVRAVKGAIKSRRAAKEALRDVARVAEGEAVASKQAVAAATDAATTVARRGFRDLVDDYFRNPGDWIRKSAHTEKATRKGARGAGASIQEVYENAKTGERMVKHTVIDDAGKVVDEHFRPIYKPRAGE